ncbi:guanylate kinase [Streptomyces sp. NPDC047046]|uniref:guanylate kinase n=1 Tax=Streptomyces sp. NPDC047046 TaxID=3155378 RepID=UPI0033CA6679
MNDRTGDGGTGTGGTGVRGTDPARTHWRGVTLFGPPAAGKDTVSAELHARAPRFAQLVKVKAGSGRTAGYRMIEAAELDRLRAGGRLLLETRRYGNTYAVDRADLDALRADGGVPLVHLGGVAHLRAFLDAVAEPWLNVLLWTPRAETARRSAGRADRDTDERLTVWDTTRADLAALDPRSGLFHLLLRTDQLAPDKAAAAIAEAHAGGPLPPGTARTVAAFLAGLAADDRPDGRPGGRPADGA